jgi:hypothetical protein
MGWGWFAAPIAIGVSRFLAGSLLAQIVKASNQELSN